MISAALFNSISQSLIQKGLIATPLIRQFPISGGSINQSYRIESSNEAFFVKINQKEKLPYLFEKEERGLQLLRSKSELKVPKPLVVGYFESHSYLVMELIETGSPKVKFWENFATGLAHLHQCSANEFGLEENNYVGSLIQENGKEKDWTTFFIENRLKVQLNLANENKRLDKSINDSFVLLFDRMSGIFPEEPPALLHGDLWSGNFLCNKEGQAVIMDPAVYFGHREMDLAMTHLFGGFDSKFYKAYESVFPLADGWQHRIDLCNLYPLLVHVNLFGAAYANRLKSVLKQILKNTL